MLNLISTAPLKSNADVSNRSFPNLRSNLESPKTTLAETEACAVDLSLLQTPLLCLGKL